MTRRAWLAFAAASVLWGIPYLFIKLALEGGFTPPSLAWARVAMASVVLLVLAWRSGKLGSLRGRWRWLIVYAIVEISIPFPMIATGEQHVASSTTAIVIASVPLIGALLALRFDHSERPTRSRALGLAVGFAGVIALVGIDVAGRTDELLGTAAILVAAIGYAIGPMVIKHRMAGLDPRATMGASLAIASVALAPFAAADAPHSMPTAKAIVAIIVLGLVCTAAAFVVFSILIHEAGTSRATVITYVNPVVALALGVTLLDERPGAGSVLGLVLILGGSWLATGGKLRAGAVARLLGRAGRLEITSAREGRRPPTRPPRAPRSREKTWNRGHAGKIPCSAARLTVLTDRIESAAETRLLYP